MKESEDKILQEYLDGSDKLSATYQSLQDEKPPAALDESILLAARESVAGKAASKKIIPVQAYSIAASVCVAVLVVSLFIGNESDLIRDGVEPLSIPVSDMPAAEIQNLQIESSDTLQESDLIGAGATNNTTLAETVLAPQAAESVQTGTAILAIDEVLEAADVAAARALQLEEIGSAQRAEVSEQFAELEALAQPDYRQSMDTWLAEIQRLTTTGNDVELEEEQRLFVQAYPDIDIDAALAELQN